MKKEEYLKKKEDIEKELVKLYQEQKKLGKEYIDTNMQFPIGSKVRVTFFENVPIGERGKVVYGIVKRYEIGWNDEVRPVLSKVNKDGTAHKTAQEYINWWRKPLVELVD